MFLLRLISSFDFFLLIVVRLLFEEEVGNVCFVLDVGNLWSVLEWGSDWVLIVDDWVGDVDWDFVIVLLELLEEVVMVELLLY